MKGVQFVMNDKGEKTAVLIDLEKHGDVWEDFWDVSTAEKRQKEPRESLAAVRNRIGANGKSLAALFHYLCTVGREGT